MAIPPEFSTFTRILRSCKAEVHVCTNERRAALLAAYTVIVGKPLPPLPAAPFYMIDAGSRNNANAFCRCSAVTLIEASCLHAALLDKSRQVFELAKQVSHLRLVRLTKPALSWSTWYTPPYFVCHVNRGRCLRRYQCWYLADETAQDFRGESRRVPRPLQSGYSRDRSVAKKNPASDTMSR